MGMVLLWVAGCGVVDWLHWEPTPAPDDDFNLTEGTIAIEVEPEVASPGYATDASNAVDEGDAQDDADDTGRLQTWDGWYPDEDGDGYPVDAEPVTSIDRPSDYVHVTESWDDWDCDDQDPTVFPGAEDICEDGIDQDCDGEDVQGTWWFEDADADGYAGSDSVQACDQPDGYLAFSDDCDDENADVNPGATEITATTSTKTAMAATKWTSSGTPTQTVTATPPGRTRSPPARSRAATSLVGAQTATTATPT